MIRYKNTQRAHHEALIEATGNIFAGDNGGGHPHILEKGINNLYEHIRNGVIEYFKENHISWWKGAPSGNTLSSQIACLNHFFAIMHDKDSVLAMLNGVRDEFEDVLPIPCDARPQYIAFEVVSAVDHLNEKKTLTRGAVCTSVDAFIYAVHKGDGKRWLIPIEWKYTEHYDNKDKSNETRKKEEKGSNGSGQKRVSNYSGLTDASAQLKSLDNYFGSTYYQEPFYQLMRQTLWAENVIKNSSVELLKAHDYLHIHVIPSENKALLDKKYKVSGGKGMEETWRSMLTDQSKYVIVDPKTLFAPIADRYPHLASYLEKRYW